MCGMRNSELKLGFLKRNLFLFFRFHFTSSMLPDRKFTTIPMWFRFQNQNKLFYRTNTTQIFAKNRLNNIDSLLKTIKMLKCCQKKKKFKVEEFKVKNIYFPCHTLTNSKSNSWNGKSTSRTSCTMNFRSSLKCALTIPHFRFKIG